MLLFKVLQNHVKNNLVLDFAGTADEKIDLYGASYFFHNRVPII